jgi:hypothetical protein
MIFTINQLARKKSNMKSVFILLLFIFILLIQCAKDHDPSARERDIKLLTGGVWVVESVTSDVDGDLTIQYPDLMITFLTNGKDGFDGDYYIAGGGRAFPDAFGKWKLDQKLTKLVFNSGREIDFTITENNLTLSFYLEGPTDGRTTGISGDFTFVFSRKD